VGGGLGELRQLVARLPKNANSGFSAKINQALQPLVVPLAGHQNVVKMPATGLDSLFNRMQSIKNFHEG
jgi:hypothetical protein